MHCPNQIVPNLDCELTKVKEKELNKTIFIFHSQDTFHFYVGFAIKTSLLSFQAFFSIRNYKLIIFAKIVSSSDFNVSELLITSILTNFVAHFSFYSIFRPNNFSQLFIIIATNKNNQTLMAIRELRTIK